MINICGVVARSELSGQIKENSEEVRGDYAVHFGKQMSFNLMFKRGKAEKRVVTHQYKFPFNICHFQLNQIS